MKVDRDHLLASIAGKWDSRLVVSYVPNLWFCPDGIRMVEGNRVVRNKTIPEEKAREFLISQHDKMGPIGKTKFREQVYQRLRSYLRMAREWRSPGFRDRVAMKDPSGRERRKELERQYADALVGIRQEIKYLRFVRRVFGW